MLPILARTMFRMQERLLGRASFAILRQLRDSQYWPRERLEQLRLRRLREVLAAAYQHTPYWREVMDSHGIAPEDVRSLEDLRRFPLLEKAHLRAHREQMVWRGAGRRVMLVRTSGSTNEALQFYTYSQREAHINAARMRGHEWIGIRRGEKEMYFWGSPVELSKQDRIKRFRDWLVNDGLTNGFEITPRLVPEYFRQWMRWRPRCIFGYPCSLVLMVQMARAQGIDLSALRDRGLKVICTTSEMLTDVDRRLISEAFGVPVYDSYGLREGGLVGHECEHATMHCVDEQVILETIDPDTLEPTAETGELVLTNIVSKVMPIIRYRTRDITYLYDGECSCGRTHVKHAPIKGRSDDMIIVKGTNIFPSQVEEAVMKHPEAGNNWLMIIEKQGDMDTITVKVEGKQKYDEREKERIAAAIQKEIRVITTFGMRVEVVDPDTLPVSEGKARRVIDKRK